MLNVVLYQPEIPANTGNIGRTCVLTGARLHLVGPLGFSLDDRMVRRAGLAYWSSLDVREYADWDEFLARNPQARGRGVHLLTKSGARSYAESTYCDEDWLVFGKESTGLPLEMLQAHPEQCERIPMLTDEDALSNAPAWRQQHLALSRGSHLRQDICGNFVPDDLGQETQKLPQASGEACKEVDSMPLRDSRALQITSLNLSNAVAIVLYEALRQTGFPGMK
jgi:tRNA (cytidine/uridine-2'-O-)-methyltransferase